jgi:hypothetical protein
MTSKIQNKHFPQLHDVIRLFDCFIYYYYYYFDWHPTPMYNPERRLCAFPDRRARVYHSVLALAKSIQSDRLAIRLLVTKGADSRQNMTAKDSAVGVSSDVSRAVQNS